MIKVKKLLKSNFAAWDTFVLRANNGTIFHLRDFLNYHPKNRFKDFSLEFHKNNNLLSVIPAAVVLKNNKKLFVSHPGASFASFVTKEDFSIKDSFWNFFKESIISSFLFLLVSEDWTFE